MWIANALCGAAVFLLGLIARVAKAGWLIAGYNTMPKHEKAKYDEEALTRGIGNLMMLAGAALLLPLVALPFFEDLPVPWITASWVLFSAVIIGGLIYANTGYRFRKK